MASTYKLRTFSSVEDKRIKLANSQVARLWDSGVGTSWTTIRIGCRISIDDFGGNILSTPRFAFGICSGTSNLFMDATTTHWAGVVSDVSSWRYLAGPPASLGPNNPWTLSVAKRVGSTLTIGSAIGPGFWQIGDCAVATRTVFFLDITKGSPNFTFQLYGNSTNTPFGDVSLATFLAQVPLLTPSIANHTQGSAVTQAVDEGTDGQFSAVNIAWDRSSPAIEISDLSIVKLA